MTLLITALAAIISTILWYVNEKARFLKVGILCYEFWGAFLMWMVDAVYEYLELGELYFSPAFTASQVLPCIHGYACHHNRHNHVYLLFCCRFRIVSFC